MKKLIVIISIIMISVVIISCGKKRRWTIDRVIARQESKMQEEYEDALKGFDRNSPYETLNYPFEYLNQRKFLEENALREGVTTTESGLQYEVVQEGLKMGEKPKETSTVVVHYVGKLIDNTKFDSSRDYGGKPAEFPLNAVISGWTEGLQLMQVSSIYRFYIPYNLAYGEAGQGRIIGPYATLIFDVELLDIKN